MLRGGGRGERGEKYIKINKKLIEGNAEESADTFFGIFIEPFYEDTMIFLDCKKLSSKDTYPFIKRLKERCSKQPTNVAVIYKKNDIGIYSIQIS